MELLTESQSTAQTRTPLPDQSTRPDQACQSRNESLLLKAKVLVPVNQKSITGTRVAVKISVDLDNFEELMESYDFFGQPSIPSC